MLTHHTRTLTHAHPHRRECVPPTLANTSAVAHTMSICVRVRPRARALAPTPLLNRTHCVRIRARSRYPPELAPIARLSRTIAPHPSPRVRLSRSLRSPARDYCFQRVLPTNSLCYGCPLVRLVVEGSTVVVGLESGE